MKKCAYKNLGCKVNAFELEAMKEQMEASGWETVSFDSPADVYVIHTCTVTNIADRKSRQMIRQARRQSPDAVVVAVGCSVQAAAARGAEESVFSDADILIGTNRKTDLASAVEEFLAERDGGERIGDEAGTGRAAGRRKLTSVCADIRVERTYEEQEIRESGEHCRAFIKVEDGCDRFCSYCGIPFARGPVRSRPFAAAVREAERLARTGVKELVLNGIDLSSYAKDLPGQREGLADLVRAAAAAEGIERVRLGSLEQGVITEPFLAELAAVPEFCPQFHLSLQSGSDAVLARMNRHYTTAEYLEKCRLIRRFFPDAAVTTDIIAGFPQETEEEFAETLAFVREAAFSRIHAFPYSRREGTNAAKMSGQLTERVKKDRCRQLIALGEELSRAYGERFSGRTVEVLCEEVVRTPGGVFTEGYTKEYVRAALPGEHPVNALVRAKAAEVEEDGKLWLICE